MITRCSIRNYKCFENISISNLKRINLISGKNNVGKSCLLEALFLSEDYGNPTAITRHSAARGIERFGNTVEASARPAFYNYDTSRTIEIELDIDNHHKTTFISLSDAAEHFKEQPNKNDSSISFAETITNRKCLSFKVMMHKEDVHRSHLLTDKNKFTHHVDFSRGTQNPWYILRNGKANQGEVAIFFSNISSNDKENQVVQIMQKLEPRLENLKLLVDGDTMLHCKLKDMPRTMPIYLAGDGFVKLLSIVLAIIATPGSVVFIDEIENGLHYSILPDFWKIITEIAVDNDCQLFATTHSYELIQTAALNTEKHQDDFNFLRLERNKGGEVITKQIDYEMLQAAVETDLEVR